MQCHNGPTLEADVCLPKVLSQFPHQPLKWQFSEEQLCGFLVPSNLSQGYCAWPVPVGFLLCLLISWQSLPTTGGCLFLSQLPGCHLLTRGFTTTWQLWMVLEPFIITIVWQRGRVVSMFYCHLMIHLMGMIYCIPISILFSSLVLSCRPPPIHTSCHSSYGTWSSFYLEFSWFES